MTYFQPSISYYFGIVMLVSKMQFLIAESFWGGVKLCGTQCSVKPCGVHRDGGKSENLGGDQ